MTISTTAKIILSTAISLTLATPTSAGPLNANPAQKAETTDISWLADHAAMRQLNELGQYAAREDNWAEAAGHFERASEFSAAVPSPIGLWLDFAAMDAYARAGNSAKVIEIIRASAGRGFRFPEYIEGNSVFDKIKNDADFQRALAKIKDTSNAFRAARSNPDDAKLIFDDVPKFWAAYDLAEKERRSAAKAAKFREHYLASGSPGLIDYHWSKTKSAEQLVRKIEEAPDYYKGIREQTLKAASFEPQIREGFRKLKALYPDAHFPDVTFVVGRLNSGGTAGPSGMLIGLDVWSWTEEVPLDGISPGFQKILQNSDLNRLPYIVVHEQIHAMQAYTGKQTLLRGVLQEGSADFLTQLAMPDIDPSPYFKWGYEHEELVWQRFQKDMLGTDYSNWIGNNNDAIGDDWHADLGYFIGAQICKAYYEQADDKQQAIKDLLYVSDAEAIFKKSGYANKFAN